MPNDAARVLLQFSRLAGEASSREIVPLLARAAVEHVGADGAAVFEVQDEGRMKIAASEGLPEALRDWSADAETIGHELGEELKAACRDRFVEAEVRPMMSGGGLFGALVLLFVRGNAPSRERLEVADGLVALAATAMGRAAQVEELRRAHAELQASHDVLVRTEKLRALGEMAAGISHDLRNILHPMSLHLRSLAQAVDSGDVAKSRNSIDAIAQIVQHGSELLETLRRFSRQSPEPLLETVDLNRLAHEAVELAKPRMSTTGIGSIAIREQLEDPPPVTVRPSEVVSAVLNLVVNAIDAMPEGGTVFVRTRESGGGALVEVADDGPGMPPEVASHVFDPFFTTKGEGGTGLGLAMVRGCAERHGGSASLETTPGVGTTIRIWLPRAAESAPTGEASAHRAHEHVGVLVVEDNQLSRAATCALLDDEGYAVSGVGTGTAALESLGSPGNRVDVVVTDLGLPDIGAAELVRRIRDVAPTARIIALSGRSPHDPEVLRLIREFKIAFIQKPFDIDFLVSKIDAVLGEDPSRDRAS